MKSFLEASSSNLSQSAVYMGETVDATSLPKGTIVCLTWQPDRACTVCSLGEGRFKVTEALNTKLLTYVAGSRTGKHYKII